MIVDTSALVAVLRNEAEARAFTEAMLDAMEPRLSAATFLETAIVIDAAKDPVISSRLDQFLKEIEAVIEPVTAEQAAIGREAYRDFGKGSRSGAQLNFGDCFAYALAKLSREPLLFKGNDFSQTDLESAL